MIRPDLIKAVSEALSSHQYLALEDFVVSEYANKEGDPCLLIEYRVDKKLLFKFHVPTKRTSTGEFGSDAYRFHCTMRPGREAMQESLFADERSGLLSEIRTWLGRLYDDVMAMPTERRFQEHAKAIDDLAARLASVPDELLSSDDISQFNDGLERLRTHLTEELKHHAKDKEELRTRIQELTNDIDFLKVTLESLTKRQWSEVLASRMQRWTSRFSLKHLSAGARIAGLLLPPEAAGALSGVAQVLDGISSAVDGEVRSTSPEENLEP
jgi:hypothetical protein